MNTLQLTVGLVSATGGFIIILSSVIGLYLRFRRKLKIIDIKINSKNKIVDSVLLEIKNRSTIEIITLGIGYKVKNIEGLKNYPGIYSNKRFFPKESTSIRLHVIPGSQVPLTNDLKSKLSYLFIKHNVGRMYKYKWLTIRILKNSLNEANVQ